MMSTHPHQSARTCKSISYYTATLVQRWKHQLFSFNNGAIDNTKKIEITIEVERYTPGGLGNLGTIPTP